MLDVLPKQRAPKRDKPQASNICGVRPTCEVTADKELSGEICYRLFQEYRHHRQQNNLVCFNMKRDTLYYYIKEIQISRVERSSYNQSPSEVIAFIIAFSLLATTVITYCFLFNNTLFHFY